MKVLVIALLLLGSSLLIGADITNVAKYVLKNFKTFSESELKNNSICGADKGFEDGLFRLILYIAENYLKSCTNAILYDKEFQESGSQLNFDLKDLLMHFPADYINGQISKGGTINKEFLKPRKNKCLNFLILVKDLLWTTKLLGQQPKSKVVVVSLSSRWKIEEYLQKPEARKIVNLLIASHTSQQDIFFGMEDNSLNEYSNLYTHNLLADPVGSSTVQLLTSWRCGSLARNVNLFPPKMSKGFNGKQFLVSASEQPPFTFKKRIRLEEDSNDSQLWDGVEVRLLRLLSDFLNYTIEIKEPKMLRSKSAGPSEIVIADVVANAAEIGSAGVYITNHRLTEIDFSVPHTTDCAAFITKATMSLPRYRAILGPFQLSVWITLTITYLIAILPLTFADSHSLKPLIKNPWLFENMFWHVFGTFTNLFTFSEKNSWTKSKKNASRLLIGWYWAFSIIITACYTGSIVSFITLFVFPDVIDDVNQLVKMNFRVGTLSTAGWDTWFNNSDHEKTKLLLRDIEFVPTTYEGLKNVSKSVYLPMFRPYAFLASKALMKYIVQANYTTDKRKEKLHISKHCFVPFGVSYVFPSNAIYADRFNEYILRCQQSGLLGKLLNEFKWEMERSSTGQLLQAGTGTPLREAVTSQRKLTLDDTQGMYLLMGAGYLIAVVILISEIINAYYKKRKYHSKMSDTNEQKSFKTRFSMALEFFLKKLRQEDTCNNYDEYEEFAYTNKTKPGLRDNLDINKFYLNKKPDISNHNLSEESTDDLDGRTLSNLYILNSKLLKIDDELLESKQTNSIFGSTTSLPWDWGSSDLHFRKIYDSTSLPGN